MRFILKKIDGKKKTIFSFLCFNTLVYVAMSVYKPYISVHFSNLGMSPFQIGILAALGPISAILVQPIWAMISDKTRNIIKVIRFLIVGSIVFVLLYLFTSTFLALVIVTFLYLGFSSALIPLGDAITTSYLTKEKFSFSRIRIGGTIGFAISVLFAGHIIKNNEYLSFVLCAGILILLLASTFGIPTTKAKEEPKKKIYISKLLKNKQVIFVLSLACAVHIVLSCNGAFIGVYIKELGYGSQEIGLAMMISALSEIPILLIIDKIIKKFNVFKLLVFSCFMLSIRIFILSIAENLTFVIIAQLFQGITYMVVYYSCVMFINENVDDSLKASGQSLLYVAQVGFGAVIGNIIGGYIIDGIGISKTFFICACFIFIISLLGGVFLFIYSSKKKSSGFKNKVSNNYQ